VSARATTDSLFPDGAQPSVLVANSGHHDMVGCYKGGTQHASHFICSLSELLRKYRAGVRALVRAHLLPLQLAGTLVIWRSNNPTHPTAGHRSGVLRELDRIGFEETAPVRAAGGRFVNVSLALLPYMCPTCVRARRASPAPRRQQQPQPHRQAGPGTMPSAADSEPAATSGGDLGLLSSVADRPWAYSDDGGTHVGAIAHFYRNATRSMEASMLVTQLLLNASCPSLCAHSRL
jgi:hypothetical protein